MPREEAVAQQIYSSAIGGIVPPGTPHNAKCPPARHRHAKCITAHHKGRGGWEELKGLKYTSTETEAATDCRYLDYDSNPAISAEVAAERGEHNPHKATKTN